MCQAAPGPRCASHTRAEMSTAKGALAQAKKTALRARSEADKQRAQETLYKAQSTYYKSMIEYYGTPTGEEELRESIARKERAGADTSAAKKLLLQAQRNRDERKRAGAASKSALKGAGGVVRTNSDVPAIAGRSLALTGHASSQAQEKGFSAETIAKTFRNPEEVYPSRSHPGQWRVTGNGVCLVGVPEGDKFRVITMYADRVLTPPRPDQLNTKEGRIFAERYAAGQGRGGGQG